MTTNAPKLITALHASEHQCVVALTGGGSSAIGQLLEVPGASRTLLEAVVPYATPALTDWLGGAAEQSCSAPTARAMAMASWMRARALSPDADQLIGVGATASLTSDRPKRGEHRVHVATQTATATATHTLLFAKGERGRTAEESLTAQLLLLALAKSALLDTTAALQDFAQHLLSDDQLFFAEQLATPEWTELLLGKRQYVGYPESMPPQAIFPGAFNPLHAGHRRLAALAAKRLGCPVAYELSITNVDKPPLDFVEIEERLQGLRDETGTSTALLLTDAPTFRAKAALFPGSTFVVGADTLARIADPKYYSGERHTFDQAIEQIAEQGCHFLVFGRQIDERFRTLSDLTLPPALRKLCEEVSADDFREDVSSSELRAT